MKNITGLFCFLFLSVLNLSAQSVYWIVFKDKNTSAYDYKSWLSEEAISNRQLRGIPLHQDSDAPVNELYIRELQLKGIETRFLSRWMNAVSANLSSEQIETIKHLQSVKEIIPIDKHWKLASTNVMVNSNSYHTSMSQMGIKNFLKDSLTGRGVIVGIIDAGFYDAHNSRYLGHLFSEYRILGQRDFIDPDRSDLIEEKKTSSDSHGKSVLEMIAGFNENTGEQIGMAPNARFYLARTEHGDKEYRGEEEMWVSALEWMDSQGIRLVNTSLGYAIKMDKEEDNYHLEDMNGKTTIIARAAQLATMEKGMFIVVSAGNEGDNSDWNIISSPADAEGVLSVGATKADNCERISYSSIGPEYNKYIKPNVACYSPNGTSFSAPAVCGFVACLMQKAPLLNNTELKELIEKSSHLYPFGNNYIGYGIPQASRALELIRNPKTDVSNAKEEKALSDRYIIHFDKKTRGHAIVFHKKDNRNVLNQTSYSLTGRKLKLKKPTNAERSTVVMPDMKVIEIIW